MRSIIASDVSRTVTARGGAPTSTNANGVIYLKEINPLGSWLFLSKRQTLYCAPLLLRETKLTWELPSSLTAVTTYRSTSASLFPSTWTCTKDHWFLWPLRNPQSLKNLAPLSLGLWPSRWPFSLLNVSLNLAIASYCRAFCNNNLQTTRYKHGKIRAMTKSMAYSEPTLNRDPSHFLTILSQLGDPRAQERWQLVPVLGGGGTDPQFFSHGTFQRSSLP